MLGKGHGGLYDAPTKEERRHCYADISDLSFLAISLTGFLYPLVAASKNVMDCFNSVVQ